MHIRNYQRMSLEKRLKLINSISTKKVTAEVFDIIEKNKHYLHKDYCYPYADQLEGDLTVLLANSFEKEKEHLDEFLKSSDVKILLNNGSFKERQKKGKYIFDLAHNQLDLNKKKDIFSQAYFMYASGDIGKINALKNIFLLCMEKDPLKLPGKNQAKEDKRNKKVFA